MKVTIYKCNERTNYNLDACIGILKFEGISHKTIINVDNVMTMTRGKVNPSDGFVIVTEDGKMVRHYIDLVHWLEEKGYVRCCY